MFNYPFPYNFPIQMPMFSNLYPNTFMQQSLLNYPAQIPLPLNPFQTEVPIQMKKSILQNQKQMLRRSPDILIRSPAAFPKGWVPLWVQCCADHL